MGDVSIMVQGGTCVLAEIYLLHRGTLAVKCYKDVILHPIMRPFAGAVGDQLVLIHDYARLHTTKLTVDCLTRRVLTSSTGQHVFGLSVQSERELCPSTLQHLTQATISWLFFLV